MNTLKTYTAPTLQANTFLVFWTNNLISVKGVIKVRVTAGIEDREIVAELAAIQHLIEDKGVLGQGIVGSATTQLIVSRGAIPKLHRRQSNKAHLAPYANFLTTRFAGCKISVEKDTQWLEGNVSNSAESLLVSGPHRETIYVAGLGNVMVTQHVLDRFIDRALKDVSADKAKPTAWKKLTEIVSDPSLREVARNSLWAGVNHSANGKQEGRYFLNSKKKLILVITDNPGEGKRLVTTYPATSQFSELPKAA
ncbi:MAG: hypothetical protein WCI39_12695 [Gallionellaceae bacterium]